MQTLKRYPQRKRETLQAWDSADELILEHLSRIELSGKRLLVLGDHFGALSCALERFDLTSYTDSYVSFKAIQLNSQTRIQPLIRLNDLTGIFDYAVIRIPKNLSFFEDILCHLSHHLHPDSQLICGAMVKYLPKTSFQLLARYIGDTSTSLARKKARLVFARFTRTAAEPLPPVQILIEPFKIPFVNHSNLFSRDKLDLGTRFLLQYIPRGDYQNILDLGCGNGVIGIAAGLLNPSATLTFSDESSMAIDCARINYASFFHHKPARFEWTHCYEDQRPASLDLVLCNPPFHQGGPQSGLIARQMFTDARRALIGGGKLRMIGNTHLGYREILKTIFGNSQTVAVNEKFTIVDAHK